MERGVLSVLVISLTRERFMRVLQRITPHRLFRRISIAYEFAIARRWKGRHPEFEAPTTRPTVGVMMPVDGGDKRPEK